MAETAEQEQTPEQKRRQKFLEECDTAYAALQHDPEAWKEYQDELKLWEATLMDGLDPNEDWSHLSEAHPSVLGTEAATE